MTFLATGNYRIERGFTQGAYGDDTDVADTIIAGVRASILEQSRNTLSPDDSRVSVTRWITGRFRPGTDVRPSDRIIDQRDTSKRWSVVDVRELENVPHLGDIVATLVRVTPGPVTSEDAATVPALTISYTGTQPLRSTVTTDPARPVLWISATPPSFAAGYAISGIDLWEQP